MSIWSYVYMCFGNRKLRVRSHTDTNSHSHTVAHAVACRRVAIRACPLLPFESSQQEDRRIGLEFLRRSCDKVWQTTKARAHGLMAIYGMVRPQLSDSHTIKEHWGNIHTRVSLLWFVAYFALRSHARMCGRLNNGVGPRADLRTAHGHTLLNVSNLQYFRSAAAHTLHAARARWRAPSLGERKGRIRPRPQPLRTVEQLQTTETSGIPTHRPSPCGSSAASSSCRRCLPAASLRCSCSTAVCLRS